MKILLTSTGIANQKIADALADLVGRDPSQVKVAFIPTAANVETGDKTWFFNQIKSIQQYGYHWIDVVDISAPDIDWKSRLAVADVIMVSGGNTYYLMDQVRKTGFGEWLKQNIESKVYIGISAGSIIVTPSIAVAGIDNGDPNIPGLTDLSGLGLVQFEISPHTPEHVSREANEEYRKTITNELVEIDDESAVCFKNQISTLVSK